MNKASISFIALGLAIVAVALTIYQFTSANRLKLGVVKVGVLLQEYEAVKEVQRRYTQKQAAWKSNVDTLALNFNKSVSQYNLEMPRLSMNERQQREQLLHQQGAQLERYKAEIDQKGQEEEEKMLQGTLEKMNAFIEEYGKEHGYTIIFGTTSEGSILSANEKAVDITHIILEELNNKYKSGQINK